MKRWVLTTLFAVALCAGAVSAQAAVTSGGTEYVWYTDMGRGEYNENDQFVSYEGPRLYISADQGGSYAELPGLRETQRRTGLSYVLTVEANAADDGGLSVKGRDIWSAEYTWFRDYSAQEIAAALKNPTVVTPIHVFATNGTVTVGSRYVEDYGNDDPTQPGSTGGNLLTGTYAGERIVYSTDGVTWLPADQEKGEYYSSIGSGWWDGSAFHAGDYVSADGIHWVKTEEEQVDPTFALSCELGPYRFEYAEAAGGEWGVYLMDRTSLDTGVLLPHMGQAARDKWMSIGKLRAWYGPNDTVILAAYDIYSRERLMVAIDYPISSLDWCLENLRTQFRTVSQQAGNGAGVILGVTGRERVEYNKELLRYTAETGWQRVNTPFHRVQQFYPYNGKTFVVKGDGKLYTSADGLSWECLDGRGLGDEWDWREYAFAWDGNRYISCRRTVEYSSGRGGTWGKRYDPACTQVRFLNEKFETVSSYDFGRQVEAVGYLDGVYYTQVSDGAGVSTNDYRDAASTLYRSSDGKTWTPLSDEYLMEDELFVPGYGGDKKGNLPTGDPSKPLRMEAKLDNYRLVLKRRWNDDSYVVGLRLGNAQDWVELEGSREAIQNSWIIPGEVSARYAEGGRVEVTVTDLSTPSMKCVLSYTAETLNGLLAAGLRVEDGVWDLYHVDEPEEEQGKAGVADVAVMDLPNGEREIVYRTAATGGKYMYYDSVPWSNSVMLPAYSGKDFMVLDKADGKVYLSADGVGWREATGAWIVDNRQYDSWRYSICWVGDHYIACGLLGRDSGGGGRDPAVREYVGDSRKVVLLDEDLNKIGEGDQKVSLGRVGFRDGVCYLNDLVTYRSTDGGRTWEITDIYQVHECLVPLE